MRTSLSILVCFVAACGAGSQAPASGSAPAPDAPSTGDPNDRMFRHFLDATDARDAVIEGKVEAVREPLLRLAGRSVGADTPDDWRPWIEEMQAQARRGADAKTLAEAAASVVALGTTCGECHRTTAGGPKWAGDERGYQHEERTGLQEKMQRNVWAADELWLGLTGPVHQAWSRGAATLMNIRVPGIVTLQGVPATTDRPPTGAGGLRGKEDTAGVVSSPVAEKGEAEGEGDMHPGDMGKTQGGGAKVVDLDAALRELQALGARADQARQPAEKQAALAEIIARCGACHAELGIRLH